MKRVVIWVFVLGVAFVFGRPASSPAAGRRRIAVLDFRNTSNHQELSWLSQAVAETLVTHHSTVTEQCRTDERNHEHATDGGTHSNHERTNGSRRARGLFSLSRH